MWYRVKKYFSFLWQSKNQHGVHSPFVYDFVTKCLYDRKKYPEYKLLKAHRKSLTDSKEVIEVTDFGAGSLVFTSNTRPIAAIAKNAGATRARQKILFRVASYFNIQKSLELGTSVGLATAALALAKKNKITSLEGCPQTAAVAEKHLKQFDIENVNLVVGDFKETLLAEAKKSFDLIYFDGNHSKDATLTYFEQLLPTIHNDTVWIFDDIYWSEGMTEAWEEIKRHPQVTVTIDCYWLGFVFFRREQEEEHFVIRA